MSDLNWQKCKLGDLFEVQRGSITPASTPDKDFFHHSLPAWDECGGPVVSKGSEIESNKTLVTGPCVLVSKLNPRKPRVSVIEHIDPDSQHCASTEFVCLRPITAQSLPFWGYYFSASEFAQKLDRHAIGSTNSHTRANPREPLRWIISVPPFSEQQKIAQILHTLDTQIRQTEALIAKLERIKQGLLTDLLTRGIDQNGQLRPTPDQAPHLYKDSPLGRIPREWEVTPLGRVAEIVSGVTLGSAPPGLSTKLVPYLRVANVQDGYLDLSEVKSIRVTASDAEKYRLQDGDVLMNEGGDYDKLGRGTVWRNQIPDCIHQNHVFRVRPDPSVILSDYLAAYSASPGGKSYFLRSSKQSTNLASINSTQLKAFPIPLASIREQHTINSMLCSLNARLNRESDSLRKLTTQKMGLMDDLLTGRVRVTPLLAH